jgi:hypothetical protein
MIPTNRQLRFPAVACTLNASMPGPRSNVLTWTEFRSFVHGVSSDMVFFAPLLMHAWVLFDRRQCLVSYVSCSAQDEEVYDHERVDEHEGYWVCVSAYLCILAGRMGAATCSHDGWGNVGGNVLLISVRTDDTRFISRAFMLASSRWPPKPGSTLPVHPTVAKVSWVWKKARCGRTACEEAVFGEDGYGIDEEHGNCGEC